jgi:hypothetical protein
MNSNRRKLTIAALVVFAVTLMFVPWDLTGSPNHYNTTSFAPIFFPPGLETYSKREIASSVYFSWIAIGIIYAGLFALLGEPKTTTTKKSDE